MSTMRDIIFATNNEGKLREIREIMSGYPVSVISLADAGIGIEVEEDGTTYEENAFKKADTIMRMTGKLTLADDSGLEIDYLDKQPGVYSARYLGESTPYAIKNTKILEMLRDVPDEQRTARFVSVIAAAFPSDGNSGSGCIYARGVIEGIIGHEISGENGFGYDPIFYVPEFKMTTALMEPSLKNKVSHRAKALEQMKQMLLYRFIN